MFLKACKLTTFALLFSLTAHAAELKKRWGYQLQDYKDSDIVTMEQSSDTLWVLDLFKHPELNITFAPDEITKFKKNNNLVIAYLSIGEAEDYRYYWSTLNIEELKIDNSEWEHNIRIKFWEKEWQAVMLEGNNSYIDRIINTGFDGVYLDRVDIFEYFKNKRERKNRAKQMAAFIGKIYAKGISRNPNFKIYVQNGTSIINELSKPNEEYFQYIEGFGIEDLFHPGDLKNNNPFNPDKYAMEEILEIKNRYNKLFYSIDYIWGNEADYNRYMNAAKNAGIIPLIAERELDGKLYLAK